MACMEQITIQTLVGVPLAQIYNCFIYAFGDYSVPMDLPFERFCKMMRRNGYAANLSVGAFHDGQMEGFLLNGKRNVDGMAIAYDTGTAILPEYRGMHIGDRMMDTSDKLLLASETNVHMIEVIASNIPALKLYKKHGFGLSRQLCCWRTTKEDLLSQFPQASCSYDFKPSNASELFLCRPLNTSFPAWQNFDASLMAVSEDVQAIKVYNGKGKLTGFAAWEPATGSIGRLATMDFDIAGEMLFHIACNCSSDTIRMINVDAEDTMLPVILSQLGFENWLTQQEMYKFLHP